jgi:hypothetical protein
MGNSYTRLTDVALLRRVSHYWDNRMPGNGETGLDRKVLVPIPCEDGPFFCPPRVKLVAGMPLRVEVVERQKGEDPFVEVFITPEDAKKYDYVETPAKKIEVVCYSAAALLENGGTRTTDADWELVTLLCSTNDGERMIPLTMARNQLEKTGGTKPAVPYSSDEWAHAVWENQTRGVKVRKPKQ